MKRKIVKFFRKLMGTDVLLYNIQTIKNAQFFRGMIENCKWLKYKSFAPGGWAMDNAALYTLFCIFSYVKPKNILEFGLGQSSKMVHQYATFTENVTALTIEHDKDWITFFCNNISDDINFNVKQIDKEIIQFNGFETLTYKNIAELVHKGYDLIIVDGPFGSAHYSRSQIIDFVKCGLPKQFCIFMDDTERSGEKDTIKTICEIFNDKGIRYLKKSYTGEKNEHTIICSDNLNFLTSLR